MATKPRNRRRVTGCRSRATGPDPHARLGRDPTTIANPHARPRGGSLRPVAPELPAVVDHRGAPCPVCGVAHRVAFGLQRGAEYCWDNIGVRTVWYRTEYEDGHVDEICRYQQVIAATDGTAIETVRRLQRGYPRLHLFGIDRPPTPGEVGRAKEFLATEDTET